MDGLISMGRFSCCGVFGMVSDADCRVFMFVKYYICILCGAGVGLVYWCIVGTAVEWNILNTHFATFTSYNSDLIDNYLRRVCGGVTCFTVVVRTSYPAKGAS